VQPGTILLSGASGFIGSHLSRALAEDGHRVVALVRPESGGTTRAGAGIRWDPASGDIDRAALRAVCPIAVINLAGARIDQRWTSAHRRAIHDSRVSATQLIAEALADLPEKPAVLLSGSAVGVYGAHRGEEILTERSAPGDDFLARVALEWEGATRAASDAGIRVVTMRTGVVLGRGGALARLLPIFRAGLGGRIGDGAQWMSWIGRDELPHIVRHLLDHETMHGPVNLVSPEPVRNETFTRALAGAVHRRAMLPVPAFALTLALGHMANDTILASQRALPAVLQQSGYEFRYGMLSQALRHELAR
jgi:uncharacterized protein